MTLALAVTAGLSTAACYGGPPRQDSPRFEPGTVSTAPTPQIAPDSGK